MSQKSQIQADIAINLVYEESQDILKTCGTGLNGRIYCPHSSKLYCVLNTGYGREAGLVGMVTFLYYSTLYSTCKCLRARRAISAVNSMGGLVWYIFAFQL